MTTTAEKIAVMQAFEDGKKIEYSDNGVSDWISASSPAWDWYSCHYRIAEEPPKMVDKWLWIVRPICGGSLSISTGFYVDASELHSKAPGYEIIGKAEWSKISVEVKP